MSNIAVYSPQQLLTIKQTVAADTNSVEFNLFMEAAKSYQLDPFRKQISAVVFNKDKQDKRRMAIIVGRDGLRAIAHRCGDYRPASKPTIFEIDKDLVSPANPKGIVSATVYLSKQDKTGAWYDVIGEAEWDEFAPIKDQWEYDAEKGRRAPTGEKAVDNTWAKSPKLMIAKCAEGQALRAGWPDTFGGLYSEEEMASQISDSEVNASQILADAETHKRENMLGNKSILMTMGGAGDLIRVPIGEVVDRCAEFIECSEPVEVHAWNIQNRESLRDFWTQQPNDALELKKMIEAKTANIASDA